MKKFNFKLNALLKWRRELERQVEMEMTELKQKEFSIMSSIHSVQEKQGEWMNKYNQEMCSSNGQDWIELYENYLVNLEKNRLKLESDLAVLKIKIQAVSQKLTLAYQSRRQVEVLKEKEFISYEQELKNWELKQASEIASIRFVREKQKEME